MLSLEEAGDGVVVIRWDDHENRFNLGSLSEWHAALDDLEHREGPLALVVTGSGKFFSNGLDLDRFSEAPDEAGAIVDGVHRLLGRLLVFPAWTVMAINGHAFAAGAIMAGHFQHELPHGMWMDMVLSTVATGGAQMDIFPSLHTATPTFIAMFSFRHRNKLPFKYTWPVVVFFAVNIIIATMFLRWHYIIDVVAGLTLATLAVLLSTRLTRIEAGRRFRLATENWPTFFKSPRRSTRTAELARS